MRFAYTDPPYLGCCGLYLHHHPDGFCWDVLDTHRMLIDRLCREFPDGWALSASSPSLRHLLPLCPDDVRLGPWCKSFGAFKKGVRPAYMWEPVIFRGGRNPSNGHPHEPPVKGGQQTTPKDFIVEPITLKRGLTGAKPEKVCFWIFDMLNMRVDDELVDLFPGSGAVSEAWNRYRERLPLEVA
jgi:hypothetical protein